LKLLANRLSKLVRNQIADLADAYIRHRILADGLDLCSGHEAHALLMQIDSEATPQLYFASALSPLQLTSILQHVFGHLVVLPSPPEIVVQFLLLNAASVLLT
jgi:hypothetical protein